MTALTIIPQNGWWDIDIVKTWGGYLCPLHTVLVIFLITVTKYLLRNNWGEEDFILAYSLRGYSPSWQEWGYKGVWSGWPPVTAARKQSSNKKIEQAIKTEDVPSVSYFLQQCSISLRLHNIPKLCHIPETMCSSTWAYTGHFAFKSWQVTAVFSILVTYHLYLCALQVSSIMPCYGQWNTKKRVRLQAYAFQY